MDLIIILSTSAQDIMHLRSLVNHQQVHNVVISLAPVTSHVCVRIKELLMIFCMGTVGG